MDRVQTARRYYPLKFTMWAVTLVLTAVLGLGQAWWSNAVYYRIIVDSFKDTNGDGLGDLRGVIKQISYVRALGADAVILSPLNSRSTDCSVPGLLDFSAIDPRYGTLEDFNALLEKAKSLELKVVITLPLQTISAASEWFNASTDQLPGFEDRVLWKEGSSNNPPTTNDNISWIWNEVRGAYYGSSNNEVLLNLCSEAVAAALSAAQCAWLRRGVAGVLLNPDFPADQHCGEQLARNMAAEAISCVRAANLETPVMLVESSLKPELAAKYYADGGVGANSVLSKALNSPRRSSSTMLALAVFADLLYAPTGARPTWVTSASNASRITTRYGGDMVDSINLLALVLPGTAIIQQGDELGAADTILELATNTTCWPSDSIPSSAPFPWHDSTNGGFSAGEPWLPLFPNYRYANAKTEFANDFSHVGVVRVAAAMRKSPAFGPNYEIKRMQEAIAILRWGNTGSLLLVSNVARQQTEVQLSTIAGVPAEMTVAASSTDSSCPTGTHVNLEKMLKLAPGETVLLVGPPRHCGGPGPVDKIANKLSEGWQKINKYFSNM